MILIIDGPSGVGKTSTAIGLQNKLGKEKAHYIASATIRERRPEEIHGLEHFFYDTDVFVEKKLNGDYLGYYEIYDNCYGIEKERVLNSGAEVRLITYHILENEIMKDVKNLGLNFKTVLLLPDTPEVLEGRIIRRNPKISRKAVESRLEKYFKLANAQEHYDHVIINKENELHNTIEQLVDIIKIMAINESWNKADFLLRSKVLS